MQRGQQAPRTPRSTTVSDFPIMLTLLTFDRVVPSAKTMRAIDKAAEDKEVMVISRI